MGRRYYCEYCDRSFADKANNRKSHFGGAQHIRLRRQHYNAFRDAATILSEESIKPPCKRFHSGTCDFGDDCRFSHMTDEKRRQLEQQATRYKTGKEERQRGLVEGRAPSLDDWLKSYRRRRSDQSQGTDTGGKVVYQLPPFLATIPDVPPSLLPPTAEDLEHVHQVTWG